MNSLGQCSFLIEQLSNPPTLDEGFHLIAEESKYRANVTSADTRVRSDASSKSSVVKDKNEKKDKKEQIGENRENRENVTLSLPSTSSTTSSSTFSKDWIQSLPIYGLDDAVELHIKTMTALRSKSKWSIVAVPHNITGPPVDISDLHISTDEDKEGWTGRGESGRKKGIKSGLPFSSLPSAWADGNFLPFTDFYLLSFFLIFHTFFLYGISTVFHNIIIMQLLNYYFLNISLLLAPYFILITPYSLPSFVSTFTFALSSSTTSTRSSTTTPSTSISTSHYCCSSRSSPHSPSFSPFLIPYLPLLLLLLFSGLLLLIILLLLVFFSFPFPPPLLYFSFFFLFSTTIFSSVSKVMEPKNHCTG